MLVPDPATTASPPPVAKSRCPTAVRWLVWAVYVALWSWSLERPYPDIVLQHKEFDWYFFLFGKAVHVSAYACNGTLPSAGSRHDRLTICASTTASHRSASRFRSNVVGAALSFPSGPR